MNLLDLHDGQKLINLARNCIYSKIYGQEILVPTEIKQMFKEKRGAFVTLKLYGELRGCIGYIEGIFPLWKCIVNSSISAAFNDPRFMPINKEEFNDIDIEISVLSVPEEIVAKRREQIPHMFQVGSDGLIVELNLSKGLLLPQVFVEYGSTPIEALEMTCRKAGLPASEWMNTHCRIFKFQAQIFNEKEQKTAKK